MAALMWCMVYVGTICACCMVVSKAQIHSSDKQQTPDSYDALMRWIQDVLIYDDFDAGSWQLDYESDGLTKGVAHVGRENIEPVVLQKREAGESDNKVKIARTGNLDEVAAQQKSMYDINHDLQTVLDRFATEVPAIQNNEWDYFNYRPLDELLGDVQESAISSVLSHLLGRANCSVNGVNESVICCTVTAENTSALSSICSNETDGLEELTLPEDICPKLKWEPLLKLICVPILCSLGLFGNTISFLVMWSSAYRRKSYGYYLRALAVFDNLTLIINLVTALNDVSYMMNKNDMDAMNGTSMFTYDGIMSHHTNFTCKLTEFMRHVIYLMSSWLVVCFTVDRFIAVCFPLLRVRYCTERSAIYTIISVLLCIMASQSYHLVFVEKLNRTTNPHVPCHAPNFPDPSIRLTYFGLNYFWFSFLLRFTLPFIAIAVCNGFIIYHIARMRKGRRLEETRRKHKASLAIYTLYAVCACFVVTVLPNAIVSIIQFSAFFINKQIMDPHLYCTLKMVYTPFHMLRLVNYAGNFLLYGITGRQFRKELYKLLWCCFRMRAYDKRSVQSPEPIALRADLLLTSRKNGNTAVRQK